MYEVLTELGLSNNESKAYLALLELGVTTTGKVAKKANIDRSNAYYSLERLKQRGLSSLVEKKGVKHYEAANPHMLKTILKEKESMLNKILPQLNLKQQLIDKTTTKNYESLKTLRSLLESKNEELLIIGSEEDKKYLRHTYKRLKQKPKRVFMKNIEITIFLYTKELFLVDWNAPQIIHIYNETMARNYKKMFILFPSLQQPLSSLESFHYLSNKEHALEPQICVQQE